MSTTALPIARGAQIRHFLVSVARRHPRAVFGALALHGLAAASALVAPRILGDLVEAVEGGTTTGTVDRLVLIIVGAVLLQTLFTRLASQVSLVLGERVLAELREDFVSDVLGLPIGTVEAAGSGDLLTRTSRDLDILGYSVRWALPDWVVAVVTAALTLVATVLVGWWVLVPIALGVPVLLLITRWYLARARDGYLREMATYSAMTASLTDTVEGARTIDALGLGPQRVARADDDIAGSYAAERYTLRLRSVFFPTVEVAYLVPIVTTLLFGGWLYTRGDVSIGDVTAATLYVQMLIGPLDRILYVLDHLQQGSSALARILGVAEVPDDRTATAEAPPGQEIVVRDLAFSYIAGKEVLHGIDLTVAPGERLAIVGASGAGKSTLGRLLAGIQRPDHGAVEIGGVDLMDLPLTTLRREVALVTQEHHVFAGTLRDNLAMALDGTATDDQIRDALAAVDAAEWAAALPSGLDTLVGSGGLELNPAQAQQVALARLVLTDPHTLVLDEATSLIDPRAARHLERSLAGVLEGRTVIAIAHRLFSAHDADRVAVMAEGRIIELGSHDQLIAAGGSYADLWRSWQTRSVSVTRPDAAGQRYRGSH